MGALYDDQTEKKLSRYSPAAINIQRGFAKGGGFELE